MMMSLTKQEFIRRMALFEQSGLTVSAFCKRYHIGESRFYAYRKQQRDSKELKNRAKPHFENVTISHQSGSNITKAVVFFPNSIRCELELAGKDCQMSLLRELSGL
jgi:hypothetical protein